MPWYVGNTQLDSYRYAFFAIPLVLWLFIWTGLALWHAAKRNEKWWFLFFLLVHTAGIFEILYLLFVAKIFAKKTP